jgi:hypothetical protein
MQSNVRSTDTTPSPPTSSSWIGSKVFWATLIVLVLGFPSFLQEAHIIDIMPPQVQKTLLAVCAFIAIITPLLNRMASELMGKNQDAKTDELARRSGQDPSSLPGKPPES